MKIKLLALAICAMFGLTVLVPASQPVTQDTMMTTTKHHKMSKRHHHKRHHRHHHKRHHKK